LLWTGACPYRCIEDRAPAKLKISTVAFIHGKKRKAISLCSSACCLQFQRCCVLFLYWNLLLCVRQSMKNGEFYLMIQRSNKTFLVFCCYSLLCHSVTSVMQCSSSSKLLQRSSVRRRPEFKLWQATSSLHERASKAKANVFVHPDGGLDERAVLGFEPGRRLERRATSSPRVHWANPAWRARRLRRGTRRARRTRMIAKPRHSAVRLAETNTGMCSAISQSFQITM
jgi:hypothetical protein